MKNPKRTSFWQIVRLTWLLWRSPWRDALRIGQLLHHVIPPGRDLFYLENEDLLKAFATKLAAERDQKSA